MRPRRIPVEPTRPTGAPPASDAPGRTSGSRKERWQYVQERPSFVSSVRPIPQRASGADHALETTESASALERRRDDAGHRPVE
jgi:hypothetical protein